MKKIMMKQEALDSFTRILDDIQFSIKEELAYKETSKEKIRDLLDDLKMTWLDTYNSIDVEISRSLRRLYSGYVQAKKSGDIRQADLYLDCYLSIRRKQGKGHVKGSHIL
jgi:hypothetical protein